MGSDSESGPPESIRHLRDQRPGICPPAACRRGEQQDLHRERR
jgi:hypothetical protein